MRTVGRKCLTLEMMPAMRMRKSTPCRQAYVTSRHESSLSSIITAVITYIQVMMITIILIIIVTIIIIILIILPSPSPCLRHANLWFSFHFLNMFMFIV